jgi:hypothetical protein
MTMPKPLSSLRVARGGAPVIGGGGVMSNAADAHDPSVAAYRATSPRFAQGGKSQRGGGKP